MIGRSKAAVQETFVDYSVEICKLMQGDAGEDSYLSVGEEDVDVERVQRQMIEEVYDKIAEDWNTEPCRKAKRNVGTQTMENVGVGIGREEWNEFKSELLSEVNDTMNRYFQEIKSVIDVKRDKAEILKKIKKSIDKTKHSGKK